MIRHLLFSYPTTFLSFFYSSDISIFRLEPSIMPGGGGSCKINLFFLSRNFFGANFFFKRMKVFQSKESSVLISKIVHYRSWIELPPTNWSPSPSFWAPHSFCLHAMPIKACKCHRQLNKSSIFSLLSSLNDTLQIAISNGHEKKPLNPAPR